MSKAGTLYHYLAKKTGKSLFSTEADDKVDLKHKRQADLHQRFYMNRL